MLPIKNFISFDNRLNSICIKDWFESRTHSNLYNLKRKWVTEHVEIWQVKDQTEKNEGKKLINFTKIEKRFLTVWNSRIMMMM